MIKTNKNSVKIKVESKFEDLGFQLPTDISEITSEALDAIITNVVVAKH